MKNQASTRAINWIAVLSIAGVALFLRLYAIDTLPPGLFGDEAVEGLDALDVLAGNWAIWFHAHLGREPLYVYLVALAYRVFGLSPLATRLPALVAGLLTLPAAYWMTREWARSAGLRERADRIALVATALLTVSFWHVQMTRDAHRDTLLPLVEAVGYWLLWLGIRARDWKAYAAAGTVLGLAIYTYSPGRFVGVFIAVFIAVEFLIRRFRSSNAALEFYWSGLGAAAALAILVMLPLALYFLQNPVQFSRRFESVSVFDAESPPLALAGSVTGNLAQFVLPGAGYQSKHYNLPGKPVFDLFIAPWFLAGIAIAFGRMGQPAYRFLLFWFLVMLVPAFLTADMIPKGVRALGVVPGVFVFPALALDELVERARGAFDASVWRRRGAVGLVALSFVGTTAWTANDYFVAWASMPELPLAFDADMTELAEFVGRQPSNVPILVSAEVYRHPTFMLLGQQIPTTRYQEQAGRIREFDARTTFVWGASGSNAVYAFVREYKPSDVWLGRLVSQKAEASAGEYFSAWRFDSLAPPQQALDDSFNPFLQLAGVTQYRDEPRGLALYWRVARLPKDRLDIQATLSVADAAGRQVAEVAQRLGVPPLEWAMGDIFVEWYAAEIPGDASRLWIQVRRGEQTWESAPVALR